MRGRRINGDRDGGPTQEVVRTQYLGGSKQKEPPSPILEPKNCNISIVESCVIRETLYYKIREKFFYTQSFLPGI